MSQRGPAPRPVSRHSSQSSAEEAASSSPSQPSLTRQDDSKAWPQHDLGGALVAEGGRRAQQFGPRAPGVHDSLTSPRSRATLAEGANRQQTMGAGRYGWDGSPPHHQGLQAQVPAVTQTASPAVPSAERGSPSASHPYPLSAPRRILTPKSPRAASMSRAAMRSVEAQQHLASLPPHGQRSAAPTHERSPLGGPPGMPGPPQFHGQAQRPVTPGPQPTRAAPGPTRSLSHSSMSHGLHPASPQEPMPGGNLGRDFGGRTAYASNHPYAPQHPAGRGPPGSGPMGDGRWGPGILGSLPPGVARTRNIQLTEGHQPLLTITPAHGEEIVVPVDVHQASKQADEKRQRNAGASARFRQRKKEKEKEQQQGLQKLESQNRDLERKVDELESRVGELEAARDFYRTDRNRLRDIVARTPAISEWAERGPPSPTFSRRAASFAMDDSSLPGPSSHSQQQQHPNPYGHALDHPHPPPSSYGDPSMLERPARRRRTDPNPQLPSPSYNPNAPSPLPPPMPGHPPSFGVPASPITSSAPGSARLPPLRFDQPSPSSETPPPVPSGAPPPPPSLPPQTSSPYQSYSKAAYETGWATGPRGPAEGGPR
ncbi:hypothetical protein B0T24DRAFT_182310 [Lasiosphaeria ovina]|uniref:BZIP domain-containing protein n=1 Tax=Lasiosphaeria ovina TaxID=92902 RepID=A0AAE0NEL4_9PEZI|nr:hypothetical protein B0T24DRAFT_182310 [Lasiosphaeria ovina]